jgi:murein DD-endopeptidase MepM/ murein hydrolase activator NlpD
MVDPHNIPEPPLHPDDTRPTGTFPKVESVDDMPLNGDGSLHGGEYHDGSPQDAAYYDEPPMAAWRQIVGLLSLLGAALFTAATILIMLLPAGDDDPVVAPPATSAPIIVPTATVVASLSTDTPMAAPVVVVVDDGLPILDPATAAQLLQAPPVDANTTVVGQIKRELYKPFTIIPDRPRNEVIQYTVVQGDTVAEIAERFGLEPETIAWSNPRRLVQVLRPGDVLNIPPVDGVMIIAVGSTKTIADYAQLYKITDPYLVLDSVYNDLAGYVLEQVPPSGTQIFIPGGTGEEVVWTIQVEGDPFSGSSGTSGGGNAATVVFQGSSPGSCGAQAIVGGTFWSNPVPSGGYTITQGFSSWHKAIDLGGVEGTPIVAANGGRVVFAGWDIYGYGWMVAIVHGPTLTVYAHLQDFNVGCGQDVGSGQMIGWMGNSGNSTGAHLHFEIRDFINGRYIESNPAIKIGF